MGNFFGESEEARLERERLEKEKAEKLEKERLERERLEKERKERLERLEKERKERLEKWRKKMETNDSLILRVGVESAKAIAEILKKNTTLKSLNIQGYQGSPKIGDDGAKAIAEALKNNQTLENFTLDSKYHTHTPSFSPSFSHNSRFDLASWYLCSSAKRELHISQYSSRYE